MKTLVVIFLSIASLTALYGRTPQEERAALQKLVKEREERFGAFARAASARSGIFGNKTKRDLKGQVEVLTEIIKTDNEIISLLNRFLSFRTFERTKMTYSQAELDEKYKRLQELTESLSKKLKDKETAEKSLDIRLKWSRFWNFLLLVLSAALFYLWWKIRRNN